MSKKDAVDVAMEQWRVLIPNLNTAPMATVARLGRLVDAISKRQEALYADHGLKPGEFDVLATLYRTDPDNHGVMPSRLSATLLITPGTMTNRVDGLVKRNLVERRADPDNRSRMLVVLTETGRTTLLETLPDHITLEENILDTISDADQRSLDRIVKSLLQCR
jgi:DNA-binding MarR family transcriptional regulator